MPDFAFREGGPRDKLRVLEAWEHEAHRDPEGLTPAAHKLLKSRRKPTIKAVQQEQVDRFDRS